MVPQVFSPSRALSNLAHRPPTPPREVDTDSKPGLFERISAKRSLAHTPLITTPTSSADSPITSTGSRKKVNWPENDPVVPAQPASGDRKLKSILKPYDAVTLNLGTSKLSPPYSYSTLAAMLDSIAQQLAGDDRNSKVDAYTTLSGTIRASDNLPELGSLKPRMASLLQFMKRDLTATTSTGTPDTSLIVNDLMLLLSFLHKPTIAELVTPDFGAHLVDHAIKAFQSPGTSKDVVKHLMFVLARLNLSHRNINGDRVGKLIGALHGIEANVTGKSIVVGRLDIYKNLLRSSRSHMSVNCLWIEDLFSDMLSTIKDTRTCAIELGFDAALVLGTDMKTSRGVMELFNRKDPEGSIGYAEYFASRLREMTRKKDASSADVPRIWSVVILFLRSRARQLASWTHLNLLLKVMSDCFNSSDQQVRLEANSAWNRLVYAIRPDENTSMATTNMLRSPMLEQFKRKSKASARRCRRAAVSSVCVLLYYSLKPIPSEKQLDMAWDHYVVYFVGKALVSGSLTEQSELARQDLADACDILRGLFDSTTPRAWKENRAIELNDPKSGMNASELPALDSKWLRKNAPRVFPVLEPLLEKLFWELSDEGSTISSLWETYTTSIASPAAKEVKVANETMACIANTLCFLYRIWNIGLNNVRSTSSSKGSTEFLAGFGSLILVIVRKLGLLPFTEKLLSIASQDTFIVIATPSQRPSNARGDTYCPLHHLFILLTRTSPGLQYDGNFTRMVRQILSPFFDARSTNRAKMDFILSLLSMLPAESNGPSQLLWQVLAEFATVATGGRENLEASNSRDERVRGAEYRDALRVLEFGFDLSPREPSPVWIGLFEVLSTSSIADAGDAGTAITVIEPLSRAFLTKLGGQQSKTSTGLGYCRVLVSRANYPKDRLALEAARRRMWGTINPSDSRKTATSDPYVQLYEYVQASLEAAYAFFSEDRSGTYSDFLSAIASLLRRLPEHSLLITLVKIQKGICLWVRDDHLRLSGGSRLLKMVVDLWEQVCAKLEQLYSNPPHPDVLLDLELLLASGFESKHRSIVNSTIILWNQTFGESLDHFEYPLMIKDALLRIRPSVSELKLPHFPESLDELEDGHGQPLEFVDSQEEVSQFPLISLSLDQSSGMEVEESPHTRLRRNSRPQVVTQVARSPRSQKRSLEETPESMKPRPSKRVSTPRLRHDDSQIKFSTIESSPVVENADASQLLTERQKEVKERQEAEAAMFPDIKSSANSADKRASSREKVSPRYLSSINRPFVSSERQTTPIINLQAEESDFVNSSPTPTRSLRKGDDVDDETPSSPPEARLSVVYELDDTEIPSSPPECGLEKDDAGATSLRHSAQVDPFGFGDDRTVSTFEMSDGQMLNSVEQSTGAEKTISIQTASAAGVANQLPRDELRHDSEQIQTPRTPMFHDALSSPRAVSPEKHFGSDEIYQDAYSSPTHLQKQQQMEATSSCVLSEADESSIMRRMIHIDEGSGRPRKSPRLASQTSDEADKAEETVARASNLSSSIIGVPSQKVKVRAPDVEAGVVDESDLVNTSSSSLPSLIPETPGAQAQLHILALNAEDPTTNDTIVVDVPHGYRGYQVPSRRKSGRQDRSSKTSAEPEDSPNARKRKRGELHSIETIPDSQHASPKREPSKTSPVKKRGKGRAGRLTPISPQLGADTESPLSPSIVPDWSRTSHEPSDIAVVVPSRGFEHPPEEQVGDKVADAEDLKLGDSGKPSSIEDEGGQLNEEIIRASLNMDHTTEMETENSNLIRDTRSLRTASPLLPQSHAAAMQESEAVANLAEVPRATKVDVGVQAEAATVVTIESLKSKLQSLVEDLSSATLTRDEVSELEDIFVDVKEQLLKKWKKKQSVNT